MNIKLVLPCAFAFTLVALALALSFMLENLSPSLVVITLTYIMAKTRQTKLKSIR